MKYIKEFGYKINEKLTDVDIDVDMIYDKYFSSFIKFVEDNNKINNNLIIKDSFSSAILKSPICKEAHLLNPINLYINTKKNSINNYYDPFANEIRISLHFDAIEYALGFDNLTDATDDLDYNRAKTFSKTFKESSIKGSIHHELVHWIDDTMNNKHILSKLDKANKANIRIKNINFSDFEIQSQIHNIAQLKKKHLEDWDILSFDDMIDLSPALNRASVSTNDYEAKKIWISKLKKRMFREGLLGKRMNIY